VRHRTEISFNKIARLYLPGLAPGKPGRRFRRRADCLFLRSMSRKALSPFQMEIGEAVEESADDVRKKP